MPDGTNGGRESFERRAWEDAYTRLSAADGDTQLGLEDLKRLAVASYLSGRDEVSIEVWTRAYHGYTLLGHVTRAARCAFWLSFILLNKPNSCPRPAHRDLDLL